MNGNEVKEVEEIEEGKDRRLRGGSSGGLRIPGERMGVERHDP